MPQPAIAIITYKRPEYLNLCLSSIAQHTSGSYQTLVVSDTDEDKETISICKKHKVDVIAAPNRGVVWNKNRGLYHFMSRTDCDPILLLEDDTRPIKSGWLDEWVEAAHRWHHVNYSHWKIFVDGDAREGDGTPLRPHIHNIVTGQCTAVSRHAMRLGGYLDTRFKGFGHGHVEWTMRHARLLYKNKVPGFSNEDMLFLSIPGGLQREEAPTFRDENQLSRNAELLQRTMTNTPGYMEPWQSPAEKQAMVAEIEGRSGRKIYGFRGISRPRTTALDFRGSLDGCVRKQGRFMARGWAMTPHGTRAPDFLLTIGDRTIVDKVVSRSQRPDVGRAFPGVDLDCGFEIAFDLPAEMSATHSGLEVKVMPVADGVPGTPLPCTERVVWPPTGAAITVPDEPHMPPKGAARLIELMRGSKCYLEYGGGGTTVKASEVGVPVIVSVESDPDWMEAVSGRIDERPGNSEVVLLHADIGPTKEWGLPASDAAWKNYPSYALEVWAECNRRGLEPDLILIDGRFRAACGYASLLFARPGTRILFDDYLDRPDLAAVERFVKPEATFDRVAEFVVPDVLPRDELWLALVAASSNPA